MSMTIARRAADYDGHRITVSADDGVPIAVRTHGADDAPLTIVFVHGHCLRTESWSFLRDQLLRQWGTVGEAAGRHSGMAVGEADGAGWYSGMAVSEADGGWHSGLTVSEAGGAGWHSGLTVSEADGPGKYSDGAIGEIDVADYRGTDPRMVFYDHRGHGESGVAHPSTYTIDQLGHDLEAVLRTVVPTGPIILVGHSMGAMVTLAYSRLFPAAIGTRVVGIGLIAGAANGLTEVGLGRLLSRRAVNSLQTAVLRAPRLMHASKRLSRRIFEPIAREANMGTKTTNRRMVAIAAAMMNDTPLLTMSSFLASLITFDESASLPRLGDIPALVLAGSADIVVPFTHSVVLASQLAGSQLVRLEGAGHSVHLERAEEVAAYIVDLVDRVIIAMRGQGPGYATAS
ncbi:alpha/beta hydrolase [Nocardia sp. NPDC005998]|uniref:alpha/beta fold hydrolase n=1 Tax=Nocardia sp. NPDC005998 TaxID=3156894 RepID=UPI0033BC6122